MQSRALVSIIIANWNGGSVLKECLSSLLLIDYPNFELILVDNGSSDGSEKYVEVLKKKIRKVVVIKNQENLGFAVANNQGYKKSKGEYILLLNNDTTQKRDFLSKMVDRIEKEDDLGVIQPKILLKDKPGYLDNAGSMLTFIGFLDHQGFMKKDGIVFNREKEVFSAKGACMLIRREVIEKVGLFDEIFFSYFEESDFCWRVWLIGYRVIFFPDARIYHKLGFTVKRLNVGDINYHYYKNRIRSILKNSGPLFLITMMPLHLFISMGICLAFILRGNLSNSMMILRAILWNLINIKDTKSLRLIIQRKRIKGDLVIYYRLSSQVNFSKFFKDFKRVENDIRR